VLSVFRGAFFPLLLREVDFSQFYTIFRKIVRSRFPVRLFTAPPVSPDMQNTPPNFEILAVYFEAKRWYINFVRTFCGQRTCIHAAVSKRRDNFDREVIGVFWYHCVMERLYHPACGAYTSFGVARQFFCETRTEFLRKNSQVLRSKSETRSLASTAPKMEGAVHVKGRVLAWGGAAFAAPPLAFCPWGSSYPSVASPASSAASWAATGSVYSDQP
jgi:hypothetical protein